jgi:RNA-directed DNA polymerase
MHDPEKSDSGIVVTKPTNKAGRPVAEPVEPRPGTKGNADQQSTHRAQSRARVTQALSRVRQAARQRKKEKFTALLHHISVDTLRTAFYALKRKAAPEIESSVDLAHKMIFGDRIAKTKLVEQSSAPCSHREIARKRQRR